LRTAEGRLALLTVILAVAAVAIYFVQLASQPAPPSPGVLRESAMVRDLRAGMTHTTFLIKYGKPTRMERRPDGLYRLYYDHVTVTFDEAGGAVEILPR